MLASSAVAALATSVLWSSPTDGADDRVPDDAIHAGGPAADPGIDFNRDVRPILVARCFACHGPDESTRKRGLRLAALMPSEYLPSWIRDTLRSLPPVCSSSSWACQS